MDARTGLPIVGIVGAGQLARMMHQAAISLGQSARILADSPEDGAAVVASDVLVGDYRRLADLRRLAAGCDVVTFDHEHVPPEHIRALAAEGTTLLPSADALRYAQDKAAMRERLTELGAPCPPWLALPAEPEQAARAVEEFGAAHGWPVVLKAARGGYDGKGVWVADGPARAASVLADAAASGAPMLVEQRVPIVRELAAVVARSPFGQGVAWSVAETVQRDGICIEVLAPAPGLSDALADEAEALALRIARELGVVGVLAVELFLDERGQLIVNELAMRPHNSAHWTIEGARTSQFEQHLRAVLDYPLGAPSLTAPAVAMANVLGGPDDVRPGRIDERVHHCMARWPDVKIHLYGKGFRPGRKVGHVTALGQDMHRTRARARAAADYLSYGEPDER
ncbi:MAG: 5-(carboxyamino)imidazole ribonucleotide synthase [Frankiaceae bacterium]|nr:5-(carboxyamino)imidazole ribonucleotide synthase [Frankiaceae bacterium]